jgi:hypothetical protein
MHLSHANIDDCLRDTIDEILKQNRSGNLFPVSGAKEIQSAARSFSKFIAVLLYLCSDDSDITPQELRAPYPQYPYHSVQIYQVGVKIGDVLKFASEGIRNSPRAHIRHCHWHLYRVGPGRKGVRIKWLNSFLVGGQHGSDEKPEQ